MTRIGEKTNAYGHGFALGRSGFDFESNCLWNAEEPAYEYAIAGWEHGIFEYATCGELDGKMYNFEEMES